jgi:hypothetical protein
LKKLIEAGVVVVSENEGMLMTALMKKSGLSDEKAGTVFPKPPNLWSKGHQHALLSLFFVFSVAWALEQCVVFVLVLVFRSWTVIGEEYPTLKVRVSFVPRR